MRRLLCFLGLHRWEAKTKVGYGTIRDYMRCVRSEHCRYHRWACWNEEETPREVRAHLASLN